ncbi:hypothetical protein Z947_1437 [Sulfitobacter geojensis]|nr:hypothetical protein Z947_1437 [Sulfitobacter geojensis]
MAGSFGLKEAQNTPFRPLCNLNAPTGASAVRAQPREGFLAGRVAANRLHSES